MRCSEGCGTARQRCYCGGYGSFWCEGADPSRKVIFGAARRKIFFTCLGTYSGSCQQTGRSRIASGGRERDEPNLGRVQSTLLPERRSTGMILSDREIQAALHRQAIKIVPPPPDLSFQPEPGKKSPWSSTTLDLRFDKELTIWRKENAGADVSFEPPDDPAFNFDYLMKKYAELCI